MFPAIPPFAEGPGVPVGVQLKILRPVAANTLEVVAAGAIHDPRPSLQTRFGGSYPFFLMQESWLEFAEPGLQVQAGDLVGITIKSDPAIGRYFFPLIGPDGTRIVLRDVGVGDTIDLGDIFTGTLPAPPAVQVNVATIPAATPVRIDIKPGSFPNTINLGSSGNVPVAIFSTATFDATELDPQTVSLAGASVRIRGRGAPAASAQDIDADGLLDLLVHVDTEALELSEQDTEAVLVGRTLGGTNVQGSDSVRIVP